jgi:hypothetical protein
MRPHCGDCQLMPRDRCVHVNGRRAATLSTPAFGCSYFKQKSQPAALLPIPEGPQAPAGPHCPACLRSCGWEARCATCGSQIEAPWRN